MSLLDFFGPQLLSGPSVVPTVGVLQSAKVVALYFSAHWCGPCRGFTPQLAAQYKALRAAGMQIIFVSADHTEASFREYFASMPWKAVPFSQNRKAIAELLGVQGIPKLVILGADGTVLTTEGVEMLKADPSGQSLLNLAQPSAPRSIRAAHQAPASFPQVVGHTTC